MSALTLIVLAGPLLWMALAWGINRAAVDSLSTRAIRTIFAITALSPLLAILALALSEGRPIEALHDPKLLVIAIEIGLPAVLVTTGLAYWGCRGRLAAP